MSKAAFYDIISEFYGYRDEQIVTAGLDSGTALLGTYYDGELGAYKLADYFGTTTPYYAYADNLNTAYAVEYGQANSWVIPGYWAFGEGLAERYLRRADAQALADLDALCASAAYHASGSLPASDVDRHELSREWSYCVLNLIQLSRCQALSGAQETRRDACYADLLTIIDDWAVNETASYFRPFMGSIAAHALISYYDNVADAGQKTTIQAALVTLADYAWTNCWNEAGGAFLYTDRIGTNPPDAWASTDDPYAQPDLNLLIAPWYAWLWMRTSDTAWKTKAEAIFAGGLPVYTGASWTSGAYLGLRSAANPIGKHINQQIVWGTKYFDYIETGVSASQPSASRMWGWRWWGAAVGATAPAGWDASEHGTIVYHADFTDATKCLNSSDAQAADGEGIKTITDSGPNALNLTQSTAGYRPTLQTNEINGYQVARFDAGDGWGLLNAESSTMTKNRTGLTIAIVLKPNSLAAVGRFFKFNGASAQRLYIGLLNTGRWNINLTPQDGGAAQDLYTALGNPIDTSKFWVTVIKIDAAGNAVKAWIDGTEVLADADIASSGNFSNTDAAGNGDSNHLFFNFYGANGINADLAEFVIWDGALADAVCSTDITDGLMTKYGLA